MSETIPFFDGHNDTLLHLHFPDRGGGRSFFERSDHGHLDLPRAREGGFGGGFFAIHLPPDPTAPPAAASEAGPSTTLRLPPALERAYAQRLVIAMSAKLFRMEAESPDQFHVVKSASEIEQCLEKGVLAAILHFEGAESIDPEMESLEVFYRAGLRSLGIVWSRPNLFAEGVPFGFAHSPDTGPGLTDAGKALVRACNRLGIMVDVSHLNEKGFWDVAALSDAPIVASHSNAHALCPATRNLTDRQLDAIAETHGMVGVNFSVTFLRDDGARDPHTPVSVVVRHVDYLVNRIGIDCVGFGSDFDGATIPQEIGDVTGLPRLVAALRERGYDTAALRKLAHENWIRVLRETWRDA